MLTASGASPLGPAKPNSQPVSLRSEENGDANTGMPALLPDYPEKQAPSAVAPRSQPQTPGIGDAAMGMPALLPEFPEKQTPHNLAPRTQPQTPGISEPFTMVRSPNPYAGVPSLYDLYVQAAPRTGRLERFGLDVFRRRPENSGIPIDLPAGPEYVLGPGDGLTIDFWGGVSQRLFRTVDREGRLSLPEAGPLLVSGRTLGEVQEAVQRVLRTQYRDMSADISLGRLRTVRVYVVGEVTSPGAYDISSLSTPLNALFAAGGVTPRGSLRLLRHVRGQQLVEDVDVYDLLLRGIRGDLKNLENGDTLLVPPVGPLVTVDGMVRRPAVYELHGETNLAKVLDLAATVDRKLATDFDHRVELTEWIATAGDDGIPAAALGPVPSAEPAPVRDFGYAAPTAARPSATYEALPQLAVLSTARDEPADWLRAGQALERVLLAATRHGVATSLLYQPIELHDVEHAGQGWWPWPECPQIIVRFGYGPGGPATPRRPVTDLLAPSPDSAG